MKPVLEINKYGVLAPIHGVKLIIPRITLDARRGDMWDQIEGLIQDYTTVHTEEMKLFLEANKYIRSTRRNSLASGRQGLRWGMNMPPGLDILIKQYFPDLFDGIQGKKNFHKFMRKFPGFRVCEIV
jgi:hypothetical protein